MFKEKRTGFLQRFIEGTGRSVLYLATWSPRLCTLEAVANAKNYPALGSRSSLPQENLVTVEGPKHKVHHVVIPMRGSVIVLIREFECDGQIS